MRLRKKMKNQAGNGVEGKIKLKVRFNKKYKTKVFMFSTSKTSLELWLLS